jgi:hypothetical protein
LAFFPRVPVCTLLARRFSAIAEGSYDNVAAVVVRQMPAQLPSVYFRAPCVPLLICDFASDRVVLTQ